MWRMSTSLVSPGTVGVGRGPPPRGGGAARHPLRLGEKILRHILAPQVGNDTFWTLHKR